ncbi:MAG TPA: GDSL-type esterase/lipase family protein [Ktedonobacteraceae bacterium]|nr:GDSL-type esterase/lipase family protein [Ktedonobacteraceae bacterium]
MKKFIRGWFFRCFSISVLLLCLALSACAAGGSPNVTSMTHPASPSLTATTRSAQSQTFQRPITYVALGASDAVGVGSNVPGSQGYVPLIAAHLPKGSRLINLGVSGIRLHDALTEELPLAISTSPDLVTIWLVANDFVDGIAYNDYMQDLNTLLHQLHTRTHARIIMANLPDLTRLPAFANETTAQKAQMLQAIQHWNAGIAQAAASYGVTLVDLFRQGSRLTAHPEYISSDGFHPSAAGYVQLANLFWQAIDG